MKKIIIFCFVCCCLLLSGCTETTETKKDNTYDGNNEYYGFYVKVDDLDVLNFSIVFSDDELNFSDAVDMYDRVLHDAYDTINFSIINNGNKTIETYLTIDFPMDIHNRADGWIYPENDEKYSVHLTKKDGYFRIFSRGIMIYSYPKSIKNFTLKIRLVESNIGVIQDNKLSKCYLEFKSYDESYNGTIPYKEIPFKVKT